jgi:hypothetical protein
MMDVHLSLCDLLNSDENTKTPTQRHFFLPVFLMKALEPNVLPIDALVPSSCEQQKAHVLGTKRDNSTAARAFHEIIVVNSLSPFMLVITLFVRRRKSLFHLFAFSSFRRSDCKKKHLGIIFCRSLWSGTNEAAGGHGPREIRGSSCCFYGKELGRGGSGCR